MPTDRQPEHTVFLHSCHIQSRSPCLRFCRLSLCSPGAAAPDTRCSLKYGIINGSMSATLEDVSDFRSGTVRCSVRVFMPTAISTGCFTPSAQNGFCGIPAVPHHAFYRVQRTVRCARRRDSRRVADGKKECQIHRLRFFALERRDRT